MLKHVTMGLKRGLQRGNPASREKICLSETSRQKAASIATSSRLRLDIPPITKDEMRKNEQTFGPKQQTSGRNNRFVGWTLLFFAEEWVEESERLHSSV